MFSRNAHIAARLQRVTLACRLLSATALVLLGGIKLLSDSPAVHDAEHHGLPTALLWLGAPAVLAVAAAVELALGLALVFLPRRAWPSVLATFWWSAVVGIAIAVEASGVGTVDCGCMGTLEISSTTRVLVSAGLAFLAAGGSISLYGTRGSFLVGS